MNYENFVEHHEVQLAFSGVPSYFWPSLFQKLDQEVFDAGNYFSMMRNVIYNDHVTDEKYSQTKVFCTENLSRSDSNCIFLIDHAWTYQLNDAKRILTDNRNLLHRMSSLMNLIIDEEDTIEDQIESVLDKMWLYNQTYSIENLHKEVDRKDSIWYIMDEFGSNISHNDQPNFRLVPFYYAFQKISFSILFPVKDIQRGDEVTRDYVDGCQNAEMKQFMLLPWFPKSFSHLPFNFKIPSEEFFQDRQMVDLHSLSSKKLSQIIISPLKVYMDNETLSKNLTDSSFQIVDSIEEADILWFDSHFDDFKNLFETKPNVFVNQFPYEEILTAKDFLAASVHLAYANEPVDLHTMITRPPWLAATFNLHTELPEFVSYYQNRQKLELDNTWIIKPWNLARGMDTYVTNNLNKIIRLIDTGKKIACKYIERPVLFLRDDLNDYVKFDLRFIVMLKSTNPLKIFVYDRFWLRFALKAFSLNDFDDYEKHFTVFNYLDSSKIKQMYCDDFVKQFSQQYPDQDWLSVKKNLHKTIKEVFSIACKNDPPKGFGNFPQCRAMYGIDMMLEWNTNESGEKYIQPVLLEVNFMPDCVRACNYYSDFVNTVFKNLFLDEITENLPITLL